MKLIPFYLSCIYLVGIIGMLSPYADSFVLLTPLNLLVSLLLMLLYHPTKDFGFYLYMLVAGSCGFLVEVWGVNTGLLFGHYQYGATLGWHLWNTPLTMFINWATLMICSLMFINQYRPLWPLWVKSLLGAALMVGVDVWIEPVAVRYGFWSWQDAGINGFLVAPLQNYIAWFIISAVLFWFLIPLISLHQNRAAVRLLWLQILFFMLIDLQLFL